MNGESQYKIQRDQLITMQIFRVLVEYFNSLTDHPIFAKLEVLGKPTNKELIDMTQVLVKEHKVERDCLNKSGEVVSIQFSLEFAKTKVVIRVNADYIQRKTTEDKKCWDDSGLLLLNKEVPIYYSSPGEIFLKRTDLNELCQVFGFTPLQKEIDNWDGFEKITFGVGKASSSYVNCRLALILDLAIDRQNNITYCLEVMFQLQSRKEELANPMRELCKKHVFVADELIQSHEKNSIVKEMVLARALFSREAIMDLPKMLKKKTIHIPLITLKKSNEISP